MVQEKERDQLLKKRPETRDEMVHYLSVLANEKAGQKPSVFNHSYVERMEDRDKSVDF